MQTEQSFHKALRHPWPIFATALALAVVGFWPSFFAVLPDTPLPHHVHAWSATAWMTLPLLQYALIRSGRRSVHRLVGWASVLLAAVVVASGIYVVRMMAYDNITSFRLVSVKFVWLDLTGIALFSVFVAFAVFAARKRDIRLHVTTLAASALIPLEAALERLFLTVLPSLVRDFDAALYASLVFLEVACAVVIFSEWRSGRVRWPMPTLLGYYLFMHATMTPLATSESFQSFSDWFATTGRPGN
jgi:uncharacterized membrane protein